MKKPKLLLISPGYPAPTGGGTAMRAGMVAEALAEEYSVYSLVVPLSRAVRSPSGNWFEEVRTLEVTPQTGGVFRHTTAEAVQQATQMYADVEFDAVHVFRLFLAPFAEPYLRAAIPCALDLDDVDSVCFHRRADLAPDNADSLRQDADRFVREEKNWIPRFDRVFVASEVDRQRLHRSDVEVLPNAVRIPRIRAGSRSQGTFTFLFFGSMNYHPNEDAVLYFCRDVWPLLRESPAKRVRLMVAGRTPGEAVMALRSEPEVQVLGRVADPAVCYEQADAAVVPLRAGGGTRIKILEAAAYGCPVVSTSVGAEGLNVSHGNELLVGDTPMEFARHCRQLIEDTDLREGLTGRAFAWVKREHTLDQVREALRRIDR